MNKYGRPRKEDARRFGYRIRLNSDEWNQLQTLKSSGISLSNLFRDALKTKYSQLLEEENKNEPSAIF